MSAHDEVVFLSISLSAEEREFLMRITCAPHDGRLPDSTNTAMASRLRLYATAGLHAAMDRQEPQPLHIADYR